MFMFSDAKVNSLSQWLNGLNFLGWRIFSRENKPFQLFFSGSRTAEWVKVDLSRLGSKFGAYLETTSHDLDTWLGFHGDRCFNVPLVGEGFPPETNHMASSPPEFKQWKKGPWLFMVYRGWKPTQLYGDYFINHDIRIPINHPGFTGKYGRFFFVAQMHDSHGSKMCFS